MTLTLPDDRLCKISPFHDKMVRRNSLFAQMITLR